MRLQNITFGSCIYYMGEFYILTDNFKSDECGLVRIKDGKFELIDCEEYATVMENAVVILDETK